MKKIALKNRREFQKFSGLISTLKMACLVFCLLNVKMVFSQAGVSSASFSYATSSSAAFYAQMMASKDIVIEDFFNYHRHKLPLPAKNERVCLDLQWGNEGMVPQTTSLLQVGLTTPVDIVNENLSPVNICFVIDHSGSMAENGKLQKVKQALTLALKKMRADDYVSVVIYDSNTQVVISSQKMGENYSKFCAAINEINEGSSTNLNAGMITGYAEAMKNIVPKSTNKIILLTDGLVNTGETDPEKIITNSIGYNKKGIDISTIGVGNNVNFQLLQQLAKSGRGQSHFLGDEANIQKVFVDEVESLLAGIAKDVKLVITYDAALDIDEFYGYKPSLADHSITLSLDDLNQGATQIVLAKFKYKDEKNTHHPLIINAQLSYVDVGTGKTCIRKKEIQISKNLSNNRVCFSKDHDVLKNYVIANMATHLKEAAISFESRNSEKAAICLTDGIKETLLVMPGAKEDKDIVRAMDILGNSYKKLTGKNVMDQLSDITKFQKSNTMALSVPDDVDVNIPENKNQQESTYALIIGNEDYSSFQPDLNSESDAEFAINDAKIFREYAEKTLGVPARQIRYIENATAAQMNQAVAWLQNLAKIDKGKAEIIVYFSGHGLPDQNTHEACLIPVDVSGGHLEYALHLSDICKKLTEYPNQKVTVFLDACFSGGSRSKGLMASKGVKIKACSEILKGNLVVFSSSSGEETSEIMKDTRHGFFTYYLLKKMQESAGNFNFSELTDYVTAKVQKAAGLEGKNQTPCIWVSTDVSNAWKQWRLMQSDL